MTNYDLAVIGGGQGGLPAARLSPGSAARCSRIWFAGPGCYGRIRFFVFPCSFPLLLTLLSREAGDSTGNKRSWRHLIRFALILLIKILPWSD